MVQVTRTPATGEREVFERWGALRGRKGREKEGRERRLPGSRLENGGGGGGGEGAMIRNREEEDEEEGGKEVKNQIKKKR